MGLGTHRLQRSGHGLMEVGYIVWDEVRQVPVLAMAPRPFCGIEIRRIRRQPLHLQPIRMAFQQHPHRLAVHTGAIQHQEELAPQVPSQRGEEVDHLLRADVLSIHLEIEPGSATHGRERNPRDHRQAVVPVPTGVHRGLSPRRPGAAHHWLEHEPALVYQDDGPAVGAGLCLTSGHRSSHQRATASSSRSRARRSGFWQLHPIRRRIRQTCDGWYLTPNVRLITSATRASVQSSVGKPAARAPLRRMLSNSWSWSAVNRAGRPGWGLARRASIPPSSSFRFHPDTADGAAPTKRATSRTPLPCNSRLAAIRRRSSNASALPFGLIGL